MKKEVKLITIISLVCIIMTIGTINIGAAPKYWQPQFDIEGRIGGESAGFIGQAGVIYPIRQFSDSLFYTDLRGMFTSKEISEYNLGFGYRKLLKDRNWVLGGYGFRDWRNEYGLVWDQWTVGGELLSDLFDLRINGYFPTDKKVLATSLPSDQIVVIGNNVAYEEGDTNSYYQVMNGYDLEVGKRFTERWPVDLGIYLRYFNFTGENVKDFTGTGVRVDTKFDLKNDAKMTLGVDWQNDTVRDSNLEAYFGFSIPFGKGKMGVVDQTNLKDRMIVPAERDINIVIGESEPLREVKGSGKALDPESFAEVKEAWFVTAEGDGIGTKEDPTNISELTNSGEGDTIVADENDLIVVMGDDGTINTGLYSEEEAGLTLFKGQKLLSPGGSVLLGNERKDRAVEYAPDGIRATLTNDNTNNIVEIADDTTVSGIIFEGGYTSIIGPDVSGRIRVTDNKILNAQGNGIDFGGEKITSIIVKNNVIEYAFNNGIIVGGTNMLGEELPFEEYILPLESPGNSGEISVEISNNQIKEVGENALTVFLYSDDDTSIEISNNDILKANNGIEVWSYAAKTNNVKVIDNAIKTVDINGISIALNEPFEGLGEPEEVVLGSSNITAEVANNTIKKAGENGIRVKMITDNSTEADFINNQINAAQNAVGLDVLSYALGTNKVNLIKNQIDFAASGIETELYSLGDNDLTVKENKLNSFSKAGITIESEAENNNKTIVEKNTINAVGDNSIEARLLEAESSGYGLYVYNYGINHNLTNISENIVNQSDDTGIYVETFSDDLNETNVAANLIKNSYDGLSVYAYADEDVVTNINNNQVEFAEDNGISIESYSDDGNNTTEVSGNLVGLTSYNGIEVDTEAYINNKTTVSGNTVEKTYDDDSMVIYTDSNEENYTIVKDNIVKEAGEIGIDLYSNSSNANNIVEVSDNTVEIAGEDAFEIDSYSEGDNIVTIVRNTMGTVGIDDYEGLDIYLSSDGKNELLIENNTIDSVGGDGIEISMYSNYDSNNLMMKFNSINSSGEIGYDISLNSEIDNILSLLDNQITKSFEDGFELSVSANTGSNVIEIKNNEVGTTMNYGFDIYSESSNNQLDIIGNTFESTVEESLLVGVDGETAELNIRDNIIDFSNDNGIEIYLSSLDSSTINITDNEINHALNSGIVLSSYGTNLDSVISGNYIKADHYGLDVYADSNIDPTTLNLLIEENNFAKGVLGGIKLEAISEEGIDTTINAEVNDNTFNEDIDPRIIVEGEVVNVTGNQAP